MNDLQSTVGIVLQAIPYREYDKILSLFTPQGILRLFVKGTHKNYVIDPSFTAPLVKGEYIFRNTYSSLARLEEATLLSSHAFLRNSLENLEGGLALAQAIIKSQSQGKSAPELFALFSTYLETIPKAPETLVTSFFLKILKYEGLWQQELSCLECKIKLEETWRQGGALFCKTCAPPEVLFFSSEEEKQLTFLAHCRSLNEICQFSCPKEFRQKVTLLFECALKD